MIEKYSTVTSNQVELRINRVRINRSRPVIQSPKTRLIRENTWKIATFKNEANVSGSRK